jgi:type II secretory pathway pseudopilin PulG
VTTALVVAALVALAAASIIRRIRQAEARDLTAYRRRVRTADQVMDDARRWRADRRKRETREDLATCQTLWNLPTVPQQRKET